MGDRKKTLDVVCSDIAKINGKTTDEVLSNLMKVPVDQKWVSLLDRLEAASLKVVDCSGKEHDFSDGKSLAGNHYELLTSAVKRWYTTSRKLRKNRVAILEAEVKLHKQDLLLGEATRVLATLADMEQLEKWEMLMQQP